MFDDWPVDNVSVAVVYEDILSSILEPREWGHCADRSPGARHYRLITLLPWLSQLSLSLSHDCYHSSGSSRVVSVITDIVTIIADNHPCCGQLLLGADISVLCQFYCSHRNERSPPSSPGQPCAPSRAPHTHMGNRSQQISSGQSYVRGRGQRTNRQNEKIKHIDGLHILINLTLMSTSRHHTKLLLHLSVLNLI